MKKVIFAIVLSSAVFVGMLVSQIETETGVKEAPVQEAEAATFSWSVGGAGKGPCGGNEADCFPNKCPSYEEGCPKYRHCTGKAFCAMNTAGLCRIMLDDCTSDPVTKTWGLFIW